MLGADHLKPGRPERAIRPLYTLTVETQQDTFEVEALFDTCFAPGREALSSYRLRDDVSPIDELSHVARDADGILAGAIRYWPVRIGAHRVLLLGPVAVHPTRQGEGLAGRLIRETLEIARAHGWKRVMLVGDESYYGRFGFHMLTEVGMPPPTNPDRVLGFALEPAAWEGVAGEVTRDFTD